MNETKFMKRALQLAKLGAKDAAPNPMVGAVVVCDDVIIGEGYHEKCGEPHAEVNAINSVVDRSLLAKSTIYVTLEPCSHWGKTPPCADLIIDSGIKKVVIGTLDPFSKVSGRGVEKLKKAGVEVVIDILKEECLSLNAAFFTFHTKQRPYIILKWAQSSDGYMGGKLPSNMPLWFTNYACRVLVHKQRAEADAIMVGSSTIISDDPELTTRAFVGANPIRVTIDRELKLDDEFKFFDEQSPSILFTSEANFDNAKKVHSRTKIVALNEEVNVVAEVVKELYNQGVQSLIVEGGAVLMNEFIESGIWDVAYVYECKETLAEVAGGDVVVDKIFAPIIVDNFNIDYINIETISLKIMRK